MGKIICVVISDLFIPFDIIKDKKGIKKNWSNNNNNNQW